MSNSFSNQVLAPARPLEEPRRLQAAVYILPKKLDEEVARLHLEKIGVKLTRLTPAQAAYIGVNADGPYKPSITGTSVVSRKFLKELGCSVRPLAFSLSRRDSPTIAPGFNPG